MSWHPRSRSRSPQRQRAYSPSHPAPYPTGHNGREYDHAPPPRRDDRPPPPPRQYDERPPRGYEDHSREYEYERVPPPRQREPEREPPRRRGRAEDMWGEPERGDRDQPREREWDRREYHDRDRDGDRRDYDRGDRAPGRGRDYERDNGPPSDPSRDVIFLGLDPELSENELAGFLRTEFGSRIESAKIVRERSTGLSKGFGFAAFVSLQDAERFIKANYPTVTMPALYAHSEPRRVKIDFAGRREDRPEPHGPSHAEDGTRDIGQPGAGGRVLLLRGLDPGTYATEISRRIGEEIARMVGRAHGGAEAITRVAIIVDRVSSLGWGYAFVELVTTELAGALLPFLLSPQHQPNGFLISGVPVAASFAAAASFVPTPAGPLGGQYLLRAAGAGGIGAETIATQDGEYVAYWHQAAGAVENVPRDAVPIPVRGEPVIIPQTTRLFLGTLAGPWIPPTGPVPTPAPASEKPVSSDASGTTGPIKIGINLGGSLGGPAKKKKQAEEDVMIPIINKNVLGDDDEVDLIGQDSKLLSRTKGAHMIPPTSTSRKIMSNISKWNTKQTELAAPGPATKNGPPKGVSAANAAPLKPAAVPSPNVSSVASSSTTPPTVSAHGDDFDYTDTSSFETTGKVACLLCQRQFKSEDILRKHVAQSDLHKARITCFWTVTNLATESTRLAGRNRKDLLLSSTDNTYRDRAAERRQVHHQPDNPRLPPGAGKLRRPLPTTGAPPARRKRSPSPPPAVAPGVDAANVGNKLLAKMGWAAGGGLGADGAGRAEPVAVQQFEQRAGLGAAKGREAGRWEGKGGWERRREDLTKERYESSGQ